jgi:hypothetical protein
MKTMIGRIKRKKKSSLPPTKLSLEDLFGEMRDQMGFVDGSPLIF